MYSLVNFIYTEGNSFTLIHWQQIILNWKKEFKKLKLATYNFTKTEPLS